MSIHNKETKTLKLFVITILAATLLTTPVFAAPEQPSVADLQQQVNTLQTLVQVVQDQRNSVLDQLALAQTIIRQQQAKEQTAKEQATKK